MVRGEGKEIYLGEVVHINVLADAVTHKHDGAPQKKLKKSTAVHSNLHLRRDWVARFPLFQK